MSKRAKSRPIAASVIVGTMLVAISSAVLALTLDSVEVSARNITKASSAPSDDRCTRSCVSHVVAGFQPGEPARVVSGASAFGVELEPGGLRLDFSVTPPAAPVAVEVSASAGVSVGASANFVGFAEIEPVTGGRAFAAWRDNSVTKLVE